MRFTKVPFAVWLLVVLALVSSPAEATKKKNKQPDRHTEQSSSQKQEDGATKDNSSKEAKKTEDSRAEDDITPAADDKKWTMEDVEKMCSRSTNGKHSYASCVDRNTRRIGRDKTPYDRNMIGE